METNGKVIILVGTSGAGKSTWARNHVRVGESIVSADDFFQGPDGVYRFDVARLSEAHGACLRHFTARMTAQGPASDPDAPMRRAVIVDNTNSTVMEAAPYIALALAYGRRVEIRVFLTPSAIAGPRSTHGVPQRACDAMATRIAREWSDALPWHWRPENDPRIAIEYVTDAFAAAVPA